jgi:hypothetical protein
MRSALASTVKVTLKRKDGGTSTCTGSVIEKTPPLVLTAEHCTKDKTVIGLTYLNANLEPIAGEVKIKQVHEMGRRNADDSRRDVAVIELEKGTIPAASGEAVYPFGAACPIVKPTKVADGRPVPGQDQLLVAGYGANVVHTVGSGETLKIDPKKPPEGAGTLRFGTNQAVFVNEGLVTWNGMKKAIPGTRPGTDVSLGPGDSGGPTFVKVGKRYVVAGINSFLDRIKEARTPNGQINSVVDICDKDVSQFIAGVKKIGNSRAMGNRPASEDALVIGNEENSKDPHI